MGWIGALISAGTAVYSASENSKNAKRIQNSSRPWGATGPAGWVGFGNGYIDIRPTEQQAALDSRLNSLQNNALGRYSMYNNLGQDAFFNLQNQAASTDSSQGALLQGLSKNNYLPNSFFGNQSQFQQQALKAQGLGTSALNSAPDQLGIGQNFLGAGNDILNQLQGDATNSVVNFDPTTAGNQYTDLLRQQALAGEQQATASALTGLFNKGRLGTTGGANQMAGLAQAQNQADVQRQIAGQQMGMQQQLQAQQALQNNYGLAASLAGQGQGMFGQALNNAGIGMGLGQAADAFGFDRQMGLSNTNWDRANQLYTASNTATQDRFNRAMQMFGLNNASGQQALSDFQGLFGAQQSQTQTQLDLARLGASVGQQQGVAGAAAAQLRNQGNQDLIAGLLGAYNSYNQSKNSGKT